MPLFTVVSKSGTSEGARKAWLSRGQGPSGTPEARLKTATSSLMDLASKGVDTTSVAQALKDATRALRTASYASPGQEQAFAKHLEEKLAALEFSISSTQKQTVKKEDSMNLANILRPGSQRSIYKTDKLIPLPMKVRQVVVKSESLQKAQSFANAIGTARCN